MESVHTKRQDWLSISLRKEWQLTPVFLSGEPHGWRILSIGSPRVDMTERLSMQARTCRVT